MKEHDLRDTDNDLCWLLISVPSPIKCDQCGKMSVNCCPEEGDGGWWCLGCVRAWEKKHSQRWEDGSPI